MTGAGLLIVPGLRDEAPDHWQTLLAQRLPNVARVAPMGRVNVDLRIRLDAIEAAAQAIDGPLILVAHSAGCIMAAHWARRTKRLVHGALLAAPPDIDTAMPEGYPTIEALRSAGWFPVPRAPLPFATIVAASRNDPLARFERVAGLAQDWGARLVDLGDVGHLNPASGFGHWPRAEEFVRELQAA
ncbi:MAG: alpha/beta fold hydrolase [Hyphomicrobiales bacterium]|nr:alpha/beta fold hydrolase [Hyphomicrobiales bacterium]